jgi:DNA-binding NarL/FixJ family response regulator
VERLQTKSLQQRIDALGSEAMKADPSNMAGLTPRELEVLRYVAMGLTDSAVGEKLFISPRTVSQHLRSIYSKLDVSSRSAATRYAVDHGLA